jgi:hypothetical protein
VLEQENEKNNHDTIIITVKCFREITVRFSQEQRLQTEVSLKKPDDAIANIMVYEHNWQTYQDSCMRYYSLCTREERCEAIPLSQQHPKGSFP